MPHASAASLPSDVKTKAEFYDHVARSLESLVAGERDWVVVLSNAASLVYHSFADWDDGRGRGANWAGVSSPSAPVEELKRCRGKGFYLVPRLYPRRDGPSDPPTRLLLGPFQGKPACQSIALPPLSSSSTSTSGPIRGAGVCATAFLSQTTQLVPSVSAFPGHIACDADTRSEIVVPLTFEGKTVGVFDLDCVLEDGFDEEDRRGLEAVAATVVRCCDWW